MKPIIIIIALLLVATSCAKKIYVPTETHTVRTDTVYQVKVRNDTLTVKERVYEADNRYDSIAPILDSLNRVVGWDRYHFREVTKLADRDMRRLLTVIDSLRQAKADTVCKEIPIPVEVVRETRKPLHWWQSALMWCGAAGLLALMLLILYKVRKTV